MSNIVCVIDACSFINILCIDDNDMLYKSMLRNVRIRVCETVIKEINVNFIHKENLNADRSAVDKKLGELRGKCVYDSQIESACGDDFFENVKNNTNYIKSNGEFYSNALSLYLSHKENIRLTFLTDDSPAKDEFAPFFSRHQIGSIISTADFLLLLFRLDKTLTKIQMRQFLDALLKVYYADVAGLLDALRKISSEIDTDRKCRKFRKKGNIRKSLFELVKKLTDHDFEGIETLKNQLSGVPKLNEQFEKFSLVFDLSTKSGDNYLNRIKEVQNNIQNDEVMRLDFS